MKKCVSLVLVLILLLAGGGTPQPAAEDAVKEAFEAVKAMDQQTIQARFTEDPLGDGQSEDVAAQQLVEHLSCQIVSCEQTADTAVATLQITNLDMQQVMDAYITAALEDLFTNLGAGIDEMSEEELDARYEQILQDILTGGEIDTVTSEVEINLTYTEEGGWVIETTDPLTDAMMGGLLSYVDQLDTAVGQSGLAVE